MKIEVTWNKPDKTKESVGFEGGASGSDSEIELHKALAGAQAHFHQKSGAAPPLDQLTARIVQE